MPFKLSIFSSVVFLDTYAIALSPSMSQCLYSISIIRFLLACKILNSSNQLFTSREPRKILSLRKRWKSDGAMLSKYGRCDSNLNLKRHRFERFHNGEVHRRRKGARKRIRKSEREKQVENRLSIIRRVGNNGTCITASGIGK